jgi:hypothetical protein
MPNAECGMRRWTSVLVSATLFISPVLAEDKSAAFTTETIHGRVVFLAEVMQQQTGVAAVSEARERVLALQKKDGALVPLFEDVRARAFRRDERLREMDVQLVVRRYPISPLVQVLSVFEIASDGKYELDYWCEICSIAMFEKKDCECCQGEVELRRRRAD